MGFETSKLRRTLLISVRMAVCVRSTISWEFSSNKFSMLIGFVILRMAMLTCLLLESHLLYSWLRGRDSHFNLIAYWLPSWSSSAFKAFTFSISKCLDILAKLSKEKGSEKDVQRRHYKWFPFRGTVSEHRARPCFVIFRCGSSLSNCVQCYSQFNW